MPISAAGWQLFGCRRANLKHVQNGKVLEKAGIFQSLSATFPRMTKPKNPKSRELRTCGLRLMLEPSIYAAAKKAADAEQRSVSAWARRLILSALEVKR